MCMLHIPSWIIFPKFKNSKQLIVTDINDISKNVLFSIILWAQRQLRLCLMIHEVKSDYKKFSWLKSLSKVVLLQGCKTVFGLGGGL